MNGVVITGRHAVPCWEISGFVEYIEPGHREGDMILALPEGASAVRLGNDATIQQSINVTRKTYYSISFITARSCAQAEKLNVSVDPEFGVLPVQTVYTSTGWDTYSWAFKARHSTVSLSIHNTGVEEDPACGPLIIAVAIKTLSPPHRTKGTSYNLKLIESYLLLQKTLYSDQFGHLYLTREPAEEWRFRARAVHLPQHAVGRAGAADPGGRALAAARVDDHVRHQGGQVRGRAAPRRAARRARRGAGGRQGMRAAAGGGHRARVVV
jgi:hypothetical protein